MAWRCNGQEERGRGVSSTWSDGRLKAINSVLPGERSEADSTGGFHGALRAADWATVGRGRRCYACASEIVTRCLRYRHDGTAVLDSAILGRRSIFEDSVTHCVEMVETHAAALWVGNATFLSQAFFRSA